MLLLIASGDLWSHDPVWFLLPIEGLLKPKDLANFEVVKKELANFGWRFDLAASLAGVLWLVVALCLWTNRLRQSAQGLVLISILMAFVGRGLIIPEIAESKSYRDFVEEINRRVQPAEKLFLYGRFNSDPLLFYRGGIIDELEQSVPIVAAKVGAGNGYIIMDERSWKKIQSVKPDLPAPLLTSRGSGPEGDAPLVLVRADVS
jgi:hypothetical protein